MKTALITLSNEGARLVNRLASSLTGATMFLHDTVSEEFTAQRFSSIITQTEEIFDTYNNLIYVAPCGLVVRAISPHIKDKRTDPAVLVIDVGGRYVISLLSGHEGGANSLALEVSNILDAEPVITTTAEALKRFIVGIGCRRGTGSDAVIQAITSALKEAAVEISQVRLLASADIKAKEKGLLEAADRLDIPLRFISAEEIRLSTRQFKPSDFVQKRVNLPAVAEPAALLAGRRTRLVLPKKRFSGITVAIARESFSWSESDQEGL